MTQFDSLKMEKTPRHSLNDILARWRPLFGVTFFGCNSADETCNSTAMMHSQLPGHMSLIVTNARAGGSSESAAGHQFSPNGNTQHSSLHLCCGREPFIRRIISQWHRPPTVIMIGRPCQMSTGADVNVETSVSMARCSQRQTRN